MTKSNYNKTVRASKEEKKNTAVVCCRDCFWANLIQYGDSDPVLAECTRKPQPYSDRFPYEVMVASARWVCPLYKHQDAGEKSIQHRVKVRHSPKACYKKVA